MDVKDALLDLVKSFSPQAGVDDSWVQQYDNWAPSRLVQRTYSFAAPLLFPLCYHFNTGSGDHKSTLVDILGSIATLDEMQLVMGRALYV
ncbi:hypothetical protein Ancab_029082 [Ancistrocladus abbreviatus]